MYFLLLYHGVLDVVREIAANINTKTSKKENSGLDINVYKYC